MLGRKTEVKVKFEITIKGINNLPPDFNGKFAYIEWKRGDKKENCGETQKVTIKDKSAIFEELISFESTLLQHVKSKTFNEKIIEFELKETSQKKKL